MVRKYVWLLSYVIIAACSGSQAPSPESTENVIEAQDEPSKADVEHSDCFKECITGRDIETPRKELAHTCICLAKCEDIDHPEYQECNKLRR